MSLSRPFNHTFISSSFDGTIKKWNSKSGRCLKTITKETPGSIYGSLCLPQANVFVSSSWNNTIKIWSYSLGQLHKIIKVEEDNMSLLELHPTKGIILCGQEGKVAIKDIDDPKKDIILNFGKNLGSTRAAFSPKEGELVIAFVHKGIIVIYDMASNKHKEKIVLNEKIIHMTFIHDNFIAALDYDGKLSFFSLESGALVKQLFLDPDKKRISSVCSL
jgi:WD40 repeat protein